MRRDVRRRLFIGSTERPPHRDKVATPLRRLTITRCYKDPPL